jgi:hypothetical protein
MIEHGDEVRETHGGRLGVVEALSSSVQACPGGRREVFEVCVLWDGSAEASWCGEADVQTTGYKRELRGMRRLVR